MPPIGQEHEETLEKAFARAPAAFLENRPPEAPRSLQKACDVVFTSKTQAYREVLLGCLLTRIIDPTKDVRLPYVDLRENAFSGRSLDEQVVNPFLHEKNIPCSRGPYLSVFRRQVKFDEGTRAGLKDKAGYDALLSIMGIIERQEDRSALLGTLEYLLYRFILLREDSKIDLVSLERISVTQYKKLIDALLAKPSGGVFPFLLVLAMVETIVDRFGLAWQVEFHGINVADRASGTGGDITIKEEGKTLLTIEVTERPVDASRVQATFKEKTAPAGLSDYVFLVHLSRIENGARQQAEKYFTHGYDVNLVDIQEWICNTLVTVGTKGRKHFQARAIHHLSKTQIPKLLKVAWNEEIQALTR